MKPRHVFFDLDGTLIDSLPGIESSARAAAAAIVPDRVVPPLRPLIGPPLPVMLRLALGELSEEMTDRLAAAFRSHYDTVGWRETLLFEGAVDVLKGFAASEAVCYIVTNKRHAPTIKIVEHLGLLDYFAEVVAPAGHGLHFPSKSEALASLVLRRGIAPESALFIGDSEDDARAAQASKVRFVAALYGYGNPLAEGDHSATVRINNLNELLTMQAHGWQPVGDAT